MPAGAMGGILVVGSKTKRAVHTVCTNSPVRNVTQGCGRLFAFFEGVVGVGQGFAGLVGEAAGRDHLGHVIGFDKDGFVASDLGFDLVHAGLVAGGVTHVVGHGGGVFRLQEEVDERHGVVGVLGVFGHSHGVKENQGAGAGQQGHDLVFATILLHPTSGLVDVARPADHGAGFAAGDVVDHGRAEDAHVFADLGQHLVGEFVIGRVVGVGVFADVMQGHRHDLGGRIQVGNATGLQLAGVLGLENQVPGVLGDGHAFQCLFNHGLVDAQGGETPGPG